MENKTNILEREKEPFPSKLRFLMDERTPKVTQKELADYLGLSAQSVSYYRQGRNSPDPKTLVKIAQYFNVSTDYLLGLSDVPTSDMDLKAVCEYTGLSEDAADKLHKSIKSGRFNLDNCFMLDQDGKNISDKLLLLNYSSNFRNFIEVLSDDESSSLFLDAFSEIGFTANQYSEKDFDESKLGILTVEELISEVDRADSLIKEINYSVFMYTESAKALAVELNDITRIILNLHRYRNAAIEISAEKVEKKNDGKH